MASLLPSRCLLRATPLASRLSLTDKTSAILDNFRTHMNHGSGELLHAAPPQTGPREPIELGLDAARATQNILRLLESSSQGGYRDTLDTTWHPKGLVWRGGGVALTPSQAQRQRSSNHVSPAKLEWLAFADNRTALAKIQETNGFYKYISMLRLDDSPSNNRVLPNDGWQILRSLESSSSSENLMKNNDSIVSLHNTLQTYLSIEHGGGEKDKQRAEVLFDTKASLLTAGASDPDEPPTDWSAPVGSLLEISLESYLKGVSQQTPHSKESKLHDAIVQIDVLPCHTAASATVHVGNGTQSNIVVDHLLLSCKHDNDEWTIVSKVFSPQPWPS